MEKISVTHTCGDSALKCVDCDGQVCPKCFVQCAVGNRCKKCASRFTSHVLKTSPAVIIRLGLAMVALGVGYGFLARAVPEMPFGFYGYFIQFAIWFALGKGMHRVASYKQGPKVMATAIIGLLLGLALGPFRDIAIAAMSATSSTGEESYSSYLNGQHLVNAAIMIVGVLWPFVRR
ncbi:MAG: hypothetical protein JSS86_24875 [Cyanobacteria bacterium SZAS LIN-2]|nr:hypothetical protein [Cyanobacteria bacterium SZAS LIN-2]